MFLDPSGAQVGDVVQGDEGIAYADLDINACIEPKQFHDVVGYYQRYDVFDLKVDRRRHGAENVFRPETGSVPRESTAPAEQMQTAVGEPRAEVRSGVGGLRVL